MDKIIIKDARISCNIGISENERRKKQDIFVDAELFFDIKKSASTDNIKSSIDYSEIYKLMKKISLEKEYKLVETLAEKIAAGILFGYPIRKVTLSVKKPLPYAKYAAVEISREK